MSRGPQNQIEPRLLPNLEEAQLSRGHERLLSSPFVP